MHLTHQLQDYIKTVIEKDLLSLFRMKMNSAKLFHAFQQQYNHYDVKTVFSWAVREIMFWELSKETAMSQRLYWIKGVLSCYDVDSLYTNMNSVVFFLNLAVKMKLHLNASHAEGLDCSALLFYYDEFLKRLKYDVIKINSL